MERVPGHFKRWRTPRDPHRCHPRAKRNGRGPEQRNHPKDQYPPGGRGCPRPSRRGGSKPPGSRPYTRLGVSIPHKSGHGGLTPYGLGRWAVGRFGIRVHDRSPIPHFPPRAEEEMQSDLMNGSPWESEESFQGLLSELKKTVKFRKRWAGWWVLTTNTELPAEEGHRVLQCTFVFRFLVACVAFWRAFFTAGDIRSPGWTAVTCDVNRSLRTDVSQTGHRTVLTRAFRGALTCPSVPRTAHRQDQGLAPRDVLRPSRARVSRERQYQSPLEFRRVTIRPGSRELAGAEVRNR